MKILNILDTLAAHSGRNFKIDYLTRHKDDPVLQRVVFLALDPFTQFFIRKIPSYQPAQDHGKKIQLKEAIEYLNILATREKTGHDAIAHLQNVLSSVDEDDAKVIERIIEKDLKCGVSDSTANKVWPGLIHQFPCMLASGYEEKLVDKIKWPAYAQLKMDGMRFNAIVKDGKCEFRSRNGKLIDIPSDLLPLPFIHMAGGHDVVFDGELLVVDIVGKPLDRKTGNGILNKAVKGTMSEEEADHVRATLWDVIPVGSFASGKCTSPYVERITELTSMILDVRQKTSFGHFVQFVNHTEVANAYEAQQLFLKYLGEGQEGIILKDRFGIWEDKRAKHQIKYKGEFEADLLCVGWEEGTGKNVGRLGALRLQTSCGGLEVGVGSGFNDEDRATIGRDVIGKIITVKYNAVVDDKRTETKSLFLPIFLEVREDKTTADALSKLL